MMSPTIELRGVTKSYGRTPVLRPLDLVTQRGVTGLLGPNGAGKTTLLRLVATVLAPDDGTVRLLGRDPGDAADRRHIRRRLGYQPQEPGFYPSFTAFDFVDYIALLKEMSDRRARHDEVRRVLAATGLTDRMHDKIRKLSGGMRRRVALAQALLGHPDILVLDEPTAGLDPEQRMRFREVVSSIGSERTVLLSTHQTDDVAALCDRVLVLHEGVVRFDGSPAELATVARGSVWCSDTAEAGARVSWRGPDGRMRHVGDAPPAADLVEPTIEDAYLLLAGSSARVEATL